jgi:hypothetical protein
MIPDDFKLSLFEVKVDIAFKNFVLLLNFIDETTKGSLDLMFFIVFQVADFCLDLFDMIGCRIEHS